MSSLKLKSEIKRKIKDESSNYINFLHTFVASDFPVTSVKLKGDEKYLVFKGNKYETRGFSSKFRLYVNREFNKSSPDGIYTWLLIYFNDKIIFLSTQAHNALEIHAKHTFIISKYFNEKNMDIPSKVSVIVAGELEKFDNDISFNFASGSYMGGRTDINDERSPMVDIAKYLFDDILNFDNINYLSDPTKSLIKSPDDPVSFIKSLPGGVKHHIIDAETNKKLSSIYESKLMSQLKQEYKTKDLSLKYNRPFDNTKLEKIQSEIAEIQTLKSKLFDGKRRKSKTFKKKN